MWRLSLTVLALLQVTPPTTNADLRLTVTAIKPRILVGEFTKVKIEWTALRQVSVLLGSEIVFIDDGTGLQPHAEASRTEATYHSADTTLAVGERRLTEHTLGLKRASANPALSDLEKLHASVGLVFERPGIYRIKAAHEETESNIVEVEVVPPTGTDAALLDILRTRLGLLTPIAGAEEALAGEGDALVRAHGAHPYLVPFIQTRLQGQSRENFDQRSALDFGASALAADEMWWRVETGERLYDEAWREAALRQIIESFPGRVAAERAAEALRAFDADPPTLVVNASPAGLWPPNGKLVPINVVVQLADNVDGAPVLRLASITCDDGCDPSSDIDSAAFGTDDRAFRLRARRSGGGPGRTYTISYTATDSSQNQATATTTVRVAHDQGHLPPRRPSVACGTTPQ